MSVPSRPLHPETRAFVGLLEEAAFLLPCVRECTALVSEQLRFEEGLRQRRAGDVHEGPGGARAAEVNDLGQQILARAALARQQHRGRGALRDLAREGLHTLHRFRLADQRAERERTRKIFLEAPQLACAPGRVDDTRQPERDVIHLKGLGNVVRRTRLDRLDDQIGVVVGGQHDDRKIGIDGAQFLQHRDSVPSVSR
jgi:hypothetical protein